MVHAPASNGNGGVGKPLESLLDNVGVCDPDKVRYIKETLHPVLSEMVFEAVKASPPDPCAFFLAWIIGRLDVPKSIAQPVFKWLEAEEHSEDSNKDSNEDEHSDDDDEDSNKEKDDEEESDAGEPDSPKEATTSDSKVDYDSRNMSVWSEAEPMGMGHMVSTVAPLPSAFKGGKSSTAHRHSVGGSGDGGLHRGQSLNLSGSPEKERGRRPSLQENSRPSLLGTEDGADAEPKPGPAPGKRQSILKNAGSGGLGGGGQSDRRQSMQQRRVSLSIVQGYGEAREKSIGDQKRTRRKMSVFTPIPVVAHDKIIQMIKEVPLFQKLTSEELSSLASAFKVQRFDPDEVVVRDGQKGGDLHLVVSGEGKVSVPTQVGVLKPGEFFGDHTLLKRHLAATTTVSAGNNENLVTICLEPGDLTTLGLKKKLMLHEKKLMESINRHHDQPVKKRKTADGSFDLDEEFAASVKSLEPKSEESSELIREAVKANAQLMDVLQFTSEQIEMFIEKVVPRGIPAGYDVARKGEVGESFYIVHDGLFEVQADDGHGALYNLGRVEKYRSGDSFGELALLYNAPWKGTVRAVRQSIIWVLAKNKFADIVKLKRQLRTKEYHKLISSVDMMRDRLTENQRKRLAESLEEVLFLQDEEIIKVGEVGDTFYMIYEGECSVWREGQVIAKLTKGEYFGERALLTQEPRAATVTVSSESATLLALDRSSFDMLLSDTLEQIHDTSGRRASLEASMKASINPRNSASFNHEELMEQIQDHDDLCPIELEDLQRIAVLGCGSFGLVTLEEDKAEGKWYALKRMSKGHIVHEGIKEATINEKSAMSVIKSPFVMRLYKTFKDAQFLYFLMQPALGGELFNLFHANDEWFGSETHSKFYTVCVAYALDAIHSWKIVFRDLKLENVLLDERGYALVSDFGLAKVVVGKTYTVCGTADYFAPETLRQHGHNRAVDWWALGVMLFIMMAGRSPFDAEDVMQIYKNIVKGFKKETFPDNFSPLLIELVKGLCRKKPEERLPMGPGGLKNLREHPWYQGYSWDSIAKKTWTAPYIPPTNSAEDFKNTLIEHEEPPVYPYEDDGSNWDADF